MGHAFSKDYLKASFCTGLPARIRMDPHYFSKLEKIRVRIIRVKGYGGLELRRVFRPVVADLHHFDEKQDPDPN
jgi:hypothetical protein